MRTIVLFVVGSVLTAACQAQLPLAPRERTVVADPSMVLEARGAAIEVLPAVRAQASGGKATRLVVASPASTFSASSQGVVFNYAMQAYGALTGEISFKLKGTLPADTQRFPPADYPDLVKLTDPNVYVVTAKSPKEYVVLFNRIKGRADVEWVEAVVDYSAGLQRTP